MGGNRWSLPKGNLCVSAFLDANVVELADLVWLQRSLGIAFLRLSVAPVKRSCFYRAFC
jgi:hypothetical protein